MALYCYNQTQYLFMETLFGIKIILYGMEWNGMECYRLIVLVQIYN